MLNILDVFAVIISFLTYSVEEPSYQTLFTSNDVMNLYEVRSYGTRIAIETVNDEDAFQTLAAYIGVGGEPENIASTGADMTAPVTTTDDTVADSTNDSEGEEVDMTAPVTITIDMTAPVTTSSEGIEMTSPVTTTDDSQSEEIDMTAPVSTTDESQTEEIDMTAPVSTTDESQTEEIDMTAPVTTTDESEEIDMTSPVVESDTGYMQFILPAEYDTIESAPTPTNEDVWLVEMPPAKGAVLRFSGWGTTERFEQKKKILQDKLEEDLGAPLEDKNCVQNMQYDGPWTIMFRRNEVWTCLSDDEVEILAEKFNRRKFLR